MNSFAWEKFLVLAEDLGKKSDEASLRSAISRAYYSIYHMALDFCETSMTPSFQRTRGRTDHFAIREHLKKHSDSKIRLIEKSLFTLHTNRARADYDDIYPAKIDAAAIFSITLAKKEIIKLKTFAQNNPA